VRRRAILLSTAATLGALAGTASAASPAPDPGRYAPQVRLAGGETLFPVRPEGFIAHSELVWYGCGRTAVERRAGVDPTGLGADSESPYSSPRYWRQTGEKAQPGCPADDAPPAATVAFPAGAWTRPLSNPRGGRAPRPGPLQAHPADGFALDLRDEFRPGNHDLSRVPVSYEIGRIGKGWWITYWLFYAFNSKEADQHEGDWERISVRFDRHAEPQRIAYYAHTGRPRVCAFDKLSTVGKRHPVVFSALGSHASYPAPGEFRIGAGGKIDRADERGARWSTWLSGVRSARQPWYGFGGAWGQRGSNGTTTGPAGPGQRSAEDWESGKTKPCSG
jgi:hypothetical protein